MAPEQAQDTHGVDIRADLYSLGCTAYHLLAGQVPFPGGDPVEKVLRHRVETPKPLQEFRPDVPEPLLEVIRKLLAKEARRRYQTPAELVQALLPLVPADSLKACFGAASAGAEAAALESTAAAPFLPQSIPANLRADQAETELITPTRRRLPSRFVIICSGAVLLAGLAIWILASGIFRREDPPPEKPAHTTPRWQAGPTFKPPAGIGPPLGVYAVALAPDGRLLGVACGNLNEPFDKGPVALVDVPSGKWTVIGQQAHAGNQVAFSPNGETLYTVTGTHAKHRLTGDVSFWDVAQRKLLKTENAIDAGLFALAVDPKGKWLAAAGRGTSVALFDLSAGKGPLLLKRGGKTGPNYRALAFSQNGRFLAAARSDAAIELSEADGPVEDILHRTPGSTGIISGLAFRADDTELVCTTWVAPGRKAEIRVWDLKTRRVKTVIPHGDVSILAMALSPDGKTLATGDEAGHVRLWSLESEKTLLEVKAHEAAVYSVAFSGDGKTLASGSSDGTARLWFHR
jgi:dipeptidyl aminopeptidase/acylaminoacyl peptidase